MLSLLPPSTTISSAGQVLSPRRLRNRSMLEASFSTGTMIEIGADRMSADSFSALGSFGFVKMITSCKLNV